MIKNIGVSRLIAIVLFISLNAILLSSSYLFLEPEIVKQKRAYSSAKSDLNKKYQEIVTLRNNFALLKGRLKDFTFLELSGFFDNQNKISATAKGNELALRSGVTGDLKVESAIDVSDPMATKVDHVLLKGPISIKIQARDDIDVMYFMKLMESEFPGVLQYKTIDLKRVKNLDAPSLRQIGNNMHATLVEANIEIDWYTMPSKESLNGF